jgi:hypothetical protein
VAASAAVAAVQQHDVGNRFLVTTRRTSPRDQLLSIRTVISPLFKIWKTVFLG